MRKLVFILGLLGIVSISQLVTADIVFNSVPAPSGYVGFPAATGLAGVEDYQANLTLTPYGNNTQTDFILKSFQWVGGVTVAGGVAQYQFTEADNVTPVSTFSVALPFAGNFIWTITVPDTVIRRVGGLRTTFTGGAVGQWFISNNNPTDGTSPLNPFGVPGSPPRTFAFALDGISTVPEPGSASLICLGLVAMGLVRRRR
ncbi:MAG: PEP-CTERM sorting domain-containing protein [Pirellulaceae bacterium]